MKLTYRLVMLWILSGDSLKFKKGGYKYGSKRKCTKDNEGFGRIQQG